MIDTSTLETRARAQFRRVQAENDLPAAEKIYWITDGLTLLSVHVATPDDVATWGAHLKARVRTDFNAGDGRDGTWWVTRETRVDDVEMLDVHLTVRCREYRTASAD